MIVNIISNIVPTLVGQSHQVIFRSICLDWWIQFRSIAFIVQFPCTGIIQVGPLLLSKEGRIFTNFTGLFCEWGNCFLCTRGNRLFHIGITLLPIIWRITFVIIWRWGMMIIGMATVLGVAMATMNAFAKWGSSHVVRHITRVPFCITAR